MLEGLEDINWSELDTAYGSAEYVPGRLRDLTSSDPAEWSSALFTLLNTILHQGTIYSGTTAAIPFLIELLAYPTIQCRGHILRFLADVAIANSRVDNLWRRYGEQLLDVDTYARALRRLWDEEEQADRYPGGMHEAVLQDLEQDMKSEERRQVWTASLVTEFEAKEAVWRGVKTYLSLLDDPDPRLRLHIHYLFRCLAEGASRAMTDEAAGNDAWRVISEAMVRTLEREQNALVKTSMVLGLNGLYDRWTENPEPIRSLLHTSQSVPVRLAANWYLSERGETTPVEEIAFLAGLLRNPHEIDLLFGIRARYLGKVIEPIEENDFSASLENGDENVKWMIEFPWAEPRPRIRTIACLCRLSAEYLPLIEEVLLKILETADQYGDTVPILEYLFPPDTLPPDAAMADLTMTQRRALFNLYHNDEAYVNNYLLGQIGISIDYDEWGSLEEEDD